MMAQTGFIVTIIDNFNKHDLDSRFFGLRLRSLEQAMIYGMRRVRSSVE